MFSEKFIHARMCTYIIWSDQRLTGRKDQIRRGLSCISFCDFSRPLFIGIAAIWGLHRKDSKELWNLRLVPHILCLKVQTYQHSQKRMLSKQQQTEFRQQRLIMLMMKIALGLCHVFIINLPNTHLSLLSFSVRMMDIHCVCLGLLFLQINLIAAG